MRREQDAPTPTDALGRHVLALERSLPMLERSAATIAAWGRTLASLLLGGGRLLAAGNGGCGALADHFVAELVGCFDADRPPLGAISLSSSAATASALGNDFGFEQALAREVIALGRRGDVLLCLSTSGESANVLCAVEQANARGLVTWAMVGRDKSPLAVAADARLVFDGLTPPTVQEAQLVALHMLATAIDEEIARRRSSPVQSSSARSAGE